MVTGGDVARGVGIHCWAKDTMDLFHSLRAANLKQAEPLAARMRPLTLDEFAGQQHFLGPGKLLRRMLQADRLTSVIFHGPPGTGKTTLARLIATQTSSLFLSYSAVATGVKEMRSFLLDVEENAPLDVGEFPRKESGLCKSCNFTQLCNRSK